MTQPITFGLLPLGTIPTLTLLNAIIDGVGDSEDGAVRDYCAKGLAEFFKWALKQSSNKQIKTVTSVGSLLRRIYSLLRDPSPFKRYGAAATIGYLYRDMRLYPDVVDLYVLRFSFLLPFSLSLSLSLSLSHLHMSNHASRSLHRYAMELIHHLILSLRVEGRSTKLENFPSVTLMTTKALKNVLNMFSTNQSTSTNRQKAKELAKILAKTNEDRGSYTNGGIELVTWLYRQCAVPETEARRAAMKSFQEVTKSIPGIDGKQWLNAHVGKVFGISEISLRNGPPSASKIDDDVSIESWSMWFRNLYASIDLHHWLIQNYDLNEKLYETLYSSTTTTISTKKRSRAGDDVSNSTSLIVSKSCLLGSLQALFDRSSSRFESSEYSSSSSISIAKREQISTLYIYTLRGAMDFVNQLSKSKNPLLSQIASSLLSSPSLQITTFVSALAPVELLPCRHSKSFISNHADLDRFTGACRRTLSIIPVDAKQCLKNLIDSRETLQLKSSIPSSVRGYQTLQAAGWMDRVKLVSITTLTRELEKIPAPCSPIQSEAANKLLNLALSLGWCRASKDEATSRSFLDCLLDCTEFDDENNPSKIKCLGSRFYYHFRGSFVDILSSSRDVFQVAMKRATSAMFETKTVKHISDVVFALLIRASRCRDLVPCAETSLQRLCVKWLPSTNQSRPDISKWSELTCLLRDMIVISKKKTSFMSHSSVVLNVVVSLLRNEIVSIEIKTELLEILERIMLALNKDMKKKNETVFMNTLKNIISQYFPMTSYSLQDSSEEARNYEKILQAILHIMQRTAHLDIFDLVCETTLVENVHRHEDMIVSALESLCKRIAKMSTEYAIQFWHHCFRKLIRCEV